MSRDSIIDELRATREAYAKRFDYDLWAMYRDLKEKQQRSGREVVSPAPKQPQLLEQANTEP